LKGLIFISTDLWRTKGTWTLWTLRWSRPLTGVHAVSQTILVKGEEDCLLLVNGDLKLALLSTW